MVTNRITRRDTLAARTTFTSLCSFKTKKNMMVLRHPLKHQAFPMNWTHDTSLTTLNDNPKLAIKCFVNIL